MTQTSLIAGTCLGSLHGSPYRMQVAPVLHQSIYGAGNKREGDIAMLDPPRHNSN